MADLNNNLTEQAYLCLKEKILNCEYPPDQTIFEKQLSQTIGIGRTPIREALLQLQAEAFIEIIPRQGIYVKKITSPAITELYQLRRLIEPNVAIEYKKNIENSQLFAYSRKFSELSENDGAITKEYYTLDIEFHNFIIHATKNSFLIDFYNGIMQKQYQMGIYSLLSNKNNSKQETTREHKAIINAIIAEDDEAIKKTILAHINSSLISSLETLT